MPQIEPRRIEELIVRYKLHPEIRDVFVEGDFDRRVLEGFYYEHSVTGPIVYTIETVVVDGAIRGKYNQPDGNRGRIIALAGEFSGSLPVDSHTVTCVADTDLNAFVGGQLDFPHLLYTDFTSMEMYFADERTLQKFFTVFIGKRIASETIDGLFEVAIEAFLIRVAREKICPSISWITLDRCCSVRDARIYFDRSDFLRRLLMQDGYLDQLERIEETIGANRVAIGADRRDYMHGHDFLEAVRYYLRSLVSDGRLRDGKILERALTTSGDFAQLATFNLFKTLLVRAT